MRSFVLLLVSSVGLLAAGAEIAFVSGGDIWVAPAKGGEARLLVSHPADRDSG